MGAVAARLTRRRGAEGDSRRCGRGGSAVRLSARAAASCFWARAPPSAARCRRGPSAPAAGRCGPPRPRRAAPPPPRASRRTWCGRAGGGGRCGKGDSVAGMAAGGCGEAGGGRVEEGVEGGEAPGSWRAGPAPVGQAGLAVGGGAGAGEPGHVHLEGGRGQSVSGDDRWRGLAVRGAGLGGAHRWGQCRHAPLRGGRGAAVRHGRRQREAPARRGERVRAEGAVAGARECCPLHSSRALSKLL